MTALPLFQPAPHFPGRTFNAKLDGQRLQTGAEKIFSLMQDGAWRDLSAIERATGIPQATASARLRGFGKWCDENGKGRWQMSKQRKDGRGTWIYRCQPINEGTK